MSGENYLKLIRWDKPIGTLLLLWPVLTAVWLAGSSRPFALVVIVFTLGVFLMRSAGCVMNDLADRKWDKLVERTKDRPITAGRISVKEALLFCGLLCACAFLLVCFLNALTIMMACVGVVLAVVYPFLKRFTQLPQVGLGVAFNWGIPMAYAAQQGGIPRVAWVLFFAGVFMTVAYDTMYGMVDRADDLRVGIKSTAILFGRLDRFWIGVFQALSYGCLVLVGLVYYDLNAWFWLALCLAFGTSIYQQILIARREPAQCFKAFLNNNWTWVIIFLGVVLGLMR